MDISSSIGSGMIDDDSAEFITKVDATPIIWNFLQGLDRNDLIAELIQNDLDEGATRTIISFERDRLVCEGNGAPVTSDGWERLSVLQGAGDKVPKKHGKIGVKNHGLKTAFTIGDRIRISSGGANTVQTLYANGPDNNPRPGAWPTPKPDQQAPAVGCRIVVYYRANEITVPVGESITLPRILDHDIDTLFKTACTQIPEQFCGIISPDIVPQYNITLRHWNFGEVQFVFSCKRLRKLPKTLRGIEIFGRRCDITGRIPDLPQPIHEVAIRRLLPLNEQLKHPVAEYFQRGNRYFVEVSWLTDRRGKPLVGNGQYRYPIGYPRDGDTLTGHAATFNAPFVSDNARHRPAPNETMNEVLRSQCERLLVDAIARYAVPIWSAAGLSPLVPNEQSLAKHEIVRDLLSELANRGDCPTIGWLDVMRKMAKRDKRYAALYRKAIRERLGQKARYRFIIPESLENSRVSDSSLSLICPRSERQLHPDVHPRIVALLADKNTPGFGNAFVTFEATDAIDLISGVENSWFTSLPSLENELLQLPLVRAYLNTIDDWLSIDSKDKKDREASIQEAIQLPDAQGTIEKFQDLYRDAQLPNGVPGLQVPPTIHPDLATHRLFKRPRWNLDTFTMRQFLEARTLNGADELIRHRFWKWLCSAWDSIGARERSALTKLTIWPDADGGLRRQEELCEPSSSRVARILSDSIYRPHREVLGLHKAKVRKRGINVRRDPSPAELEAWVHQRLAVFAIGATACKETVDALRQFEADLKTLCAEHRIGLELGRMELSLPARAQDGTIQLRERLVRSNKDNDRLALLPRFVLSDGNRTNALDKLCCPLSTPTAEVMLDTFEADAGHFNALQSRLLRFMSMTDPGDDYRERLSCKSIIPVHGEPRAPKELAFKGNRGDHWGEWKTQIDAAGLSTDGQNLYREAGVTSARPTARTSREFFNWLREQGEATLRRHIDCVVRHIALAPKLGNWPRSHTDIPVMLVRSKKGIGIVSVEEALNHRRRIYLDDAGLSNSIIERDASVFIIVDRVENVQSPVFEILKHWGLHSIREAIGLPTKVSGQGTVEVDKDLMVKLLPIKRRSFAQSIYKRMAQLGVNSDDIRNNWREHVNDIKEVMLADTVEAQYRFRGNTYFETVNAGFDPDTGVFWVARNQEESSGVFYEAIAAQLVFKPNTPPIYFLSLEKALEIEVRENPNLFFPRNESEATISGRDNEDGGSKPLEGGKPVVESKDGHSRWEPDPEKNRPKPSAIRSKEERRRSSYPASRPGTRNEGSRRRATPVEEAEQIEQLKSEQYVSHCQICLCLQRPDKLAPAGSYVEGAEMRRRIVEAHHVDPVDGGGARHAGNIVLLCRYHHDKYGSRLSRAAVVEAMERASKHDLKFVHDGGSETEMDGRRVGIRIPDAGDDVKLFFTVYHYDYWQKMARKESIGGL